MRATKSDEWEVVHDGGYTFMLHRPTWELTFGERLDAGCKERMPLLIDANDVNRAWRERE